MSPYVEHTTVMSEEGFPARPRPLVAAVGQGQRPPIGAVHLGGLGDRAVGGGGGV